MRMKALDPNHITAAQRLVAFVRLQQQKSSQKSADFRKSSLALSRQQRGHAEAAARAVP
jgi:hypothetical protein